MYIQHGGKVSFKKVRLYKAVYNKCSTSTVVVGLWSCWFFVLEKAAVPDSNAAFPKMAPSSCAGLQLPTSLASMTMLLGDEEYYHSAICRASGLGKAEV